MADWFAVADTDGDGYVSGAEAVQFFQRAGLPQLSLAKLWELADNPARGYLERKQFDIALQLITIAQSGGELNASQHQQIAGGFATFPLPYIQGLSGGQQQQPQSMAADGGWGGGGFSDGANNGPASASPGAFVSQHQSSFSGGFGGSMAFTPGQPQQQQQQMMGQTMSGGFGGSGDGLGGLGSLGGMGGAATVSDFGGGDGGAGGGRFGGRTSSSSGAPTGAGDAWPPVSPADMARYHQRFHQADTNGNGRLTGGEVVPVLMSLDAPKEVLKDIWALADSDKDGVIAWPEFLVAIYLTERAREGRKPPQSLPPGPFPPLQQQQGVGSSNMRPPPSPGHSRKPSTDMFSGGTGMDGPASSIGGLGGTSAAFGAGGGGGRGIPSLSGGGGGGGYGGGGGVHHSRAPSGDYGFRGPGDFDVSSAGGPDAERLRSARTEAEVADRELWEKERASSQAKVNTAHLTQKLQELVLFRRKCEASLSEAADRAERAERDVGDLRKRVSGATSAVEQATSALEASTSRTATAEAERNQLSFRLEELCAEQTSLASGGGSAHDALKAEVQLMRAQVAEAAAALGPHREEAAAAARQRMQLEMTLSELRISAEGASADTQSHRSRIAGLEREVAAAASGVTVGGDEGARAALPSALQRIAVAHDAALRRAYELGVKPPQPPISLIAALGGGGGGGGGSGSGLPADLPTWGDWADLDDEGFETVQLAWGSWGKEPPPQQLGARDTNHMTTPSPALPLQSTQQSTPQSQSLGGFGGGFDMFEGAAGATGASVASSSVAASAFDAFGAGPSGTTSVTAGLTGGSVQQLRQQQQRGFGDFGGSGDAFSAGGGVQGAGGTGGYVFGASSHAPASIGYAGQTGPPDVPSTFTTGISDWTLVSGGHKDGIAGAAGYTGGSGITSGGGAIPVDMFGGGGGNTVENFDFSGGGVAADAATPADVPHPATLNLAASDTFGADLFLAPQQQQGESNFTSQQAAAFSPPVAAGSDDLFGGGVTDPFGGGNTAWAAF